MALNEDPAARRARTGPTTAFPGGKCDKQVSHPPNQKQAILAPFRRKVAEGCFRLAALKLIHAADNVAIGDNHAAWPSIDCAEAHLAEAGDMLREVDGAT